MSGTAVGVDVAATGAVVEPIVIDTGVGVRVGRAVGVTVGRGVGVAVGRGVGVAVGRGVDVAVGGAVGVSVGGGVGVAVGRGAAVGRAISSLCRRAAAVVVRCRVGLAGGPRRARGRRRCRLPTSLLATRRNQDAPAGTRSAPALATRRSCSRTCTALRTSQMAYSWPFLRRKAKVAISGVVSLNACASLVRASTTRCREAVARRAPFVAAKR